MPTLMLRNHLVAGLSIRLDFLFVHDIRSPGNQPAVHGVFNLKLPLHLALEEMFQCP